MTELASEPRRALPPRYYLSPELFERARTSVFFRSWLFACHESQVAEAGDYLAFPVLDQDLFVARDRAGGLRAFYNVCQHRGHRLLEGSGNKRLLVCPYHAWSYDLDGRLRSAPGSGEVPGFDAGSICLTELRLEVFCGFVFVNLDLEAAPMAAHFPGVEAAVRAHCPDIETRRFVRAFAAEEPCNWLVAVENYNECYHCKVAHPTFAAGVIDSRSYNIRPFGAGKCLHHSAKAQAGAGAWYDTSGSDYASFFLWPSFSLQLYPSGLVNSYHWQPLGPAETRVHRGWYAPGGEADEAFVKVMELDRDTTFTEDLALVGSVQRGLGSLGYRPGPLVINPGEGIESEHSIAKLHDWLREAVDG